jgi:23S rRNA (uracil1939-C5)-methyltransferase
VSVSVGDVVQIPIVRLALGGDSVGRLPDGRVCFVRGAPVCDAVSVRLSVVKKKYTRGDLLASFESPLCESATACGGCPWHLSSSQDQRRALADHVQRGLSRLTWRAGADVPSWIATSPAKGWRRTIRMHWNERSLGFFGWGTHSIVNTPRCPILVDPLERARIELCQFFKDCGVGQGTVKASVGRSELVYLSLHPSVDGVTTRQAKEWQRFCEHLLTRTEAIGGLQCVVSGRVIFQTGESTYDVGSDETPHHIGSFVQANACIHDTFIDYVSAAVGAKQRVIELFSGSGAFTTRLLQAGCTVTALEGSVDACHTLREGSRYSIERGMLDVRTERINRVPSGHFDVCLLDPPRTGAKSVLSTLKPSLIERIVYVACDFGTLSRDVKTLNESGYQIECVRLFEMFPNSGHVECVVSLEPQVSLTDSQSP